MVLIIMVDKVLIIVFWFKFLVRWLDKEVFFKFCIMGNEVRDKGVCVYMCVWYL